MVAVHLRACLAMAVMFVAAAPGIGPIHAAQPQERRITWSVSNRLPQFADQRDAARYLAIVRRIMPGRSDDFADKYNESSPWPRHRPPPATRWRPVDDRYDSAALLAPSTEIDASVAGGEPDDRCAWFLDGRRIGDDCKLSGVEVPPPPAVSRLALVVRPSKGGPQEDIAVVQLRRTVVLAIGDSYASGEGAPDQSRTRRDAASWWDRRCHRSLFSGPALAAALLADHDPHRSVVFVSLACSGALAPELLADPTPVAGDEERPTFLGQEPPANTRATFRRWYPNRPLPPMAAESRLLRPQVIAAAEALCLGTYDHDRRSCGGSTVSPDFVTLSIGGNDLRFVKLMKEMLTARLTEEAKARWTAEMMTAREKLAERLLVLAGDVERHLAPEWLLLTEYPDPLRNDGDDDGEGPGGLCDDRENWAYNWNNLRIIRPTLGLRLTPIEADESGYAVEEFLEPLNGRLGNSARDLQGRGWRMVRGIARAAGRFGYCSRWSHFRTAQQALQHQGPQAAAPGELAVSFGTGHPNMQGQLLYGCMLAARMIALEQDQAWRAPLPWPRNCLGNRWDFLLADNEWIGPDGCRFSADGGLPPGEPERCYRLALEQRHQLDLGRPQELVDRAHLPQREAAVDQGAGVADEGLGLAAGVDDAAQTARRQ